MKTETHEEQSCTAASIAFGQFSVYGYSVLIIGAYVPVHTCRALCQSFFENAYSLSHNSSEWSISKLSTRTPLSHQVDARSFTMNARLSVLLARRHSHTRQLLITATLCSTRVFISCKWLQRQHQVAIRNPEYSIGGRDDDKRVHALRVRECASLHATQRAAEDRHVVVDVLVTCARPNSNPEANLQAKDLFEHMEIESGDGEALNSMQSPGAAFFPNRSEFRGVFTC